MKTKVLSTLVLLLALAQGVVAEGTASNFGGGDGSAKNPYLINSPDQWGKLSADVAAGTSYSGQYFLLDADITVTKMLGTGTTGNNAKPFSGTFDGGGHTLIFNHTATEEEGDIAPFRFVRSATIRNLHVDGIINTAFRHAGGLAGRTYGTTLIEGCRVSTVINSSVSGDGTHGGIVALKPDWSSAHLTIEGCVYDGKIVYTGTEATTHCAGFVGYTSYGSLTITNSIYAPAVPDEGETAVKSEYTFYRFNTKHSGTITLSNCYYTKNLGAAQGKRALSIGFPSGADFTVVPTGTATEYEVSGITAYAGNQCVKYNNVVYAGNEDVVNLTFTHNYVGCTVKDYTIDQGGNATLSNTGTDVYTLTMGQDNVIFGFSMVGPPLFQIEGNGTSDSPYIISVAEVWDYIVSLVNYGQTGYDNAYYKLTNDITVTTMMGSESHRFKGHLDGDGHTLTVNYNTDEQYTAPFRYVEAAEINNLCVAGTITTSKKFAAGFVANAQGNNSMTNCRSSVTIDSSVNGDGTHGGFVAHNLSGTFRMEGCAFDGSMLGSSTNKCGGFVGWNETNGSSEGVVYFENCFFAPTSITVDLEHTYARSRTNDGAHVQMYYSNCRTNFGDNQQFRAYSISAGDGVTVATTQSAVITYTVSGITMYNTGMMLDGLLYARDTQEMSLNLGYTGAGTLTGFSTTAGSLSGDGNPFTFTIGTADAVINAVISESGTGWSGNGSGTSESPYIICNSDKWDEFAYMVNNGVFGFNTAYYKLTADITVTTMVGTDGHKFKGHFDGDDHMLTLNYGTVESPFSENYCAPFRYIENAEIHDLTVAGTIYTKNMFAAGLAGYALNDNTITNCLSSVTINSSVNGDGTHGGFVANCQNNVDHRTSVTFTNCAFNGQLIGSNTNNWGGFVGWEESNDWAAVRFTNSLFAPSEMNIDSDGSATFSRGRNNNLSDYIIFENSYYIRSFGTMQGEMAYTTQPANVTSVAITIAGITIYVKNTAVTDITATDITPYTATISWTGSDACSNYQVRCREKMNQDIYSTSFEDGLPDGWTTFENDDDEKNWEYEDGTKKGMAYSGNGCIYSASYINNYGALNPDNWLVSEPLTLGGTLKVWLKGQDADEYREHFAIYLSTTGGNKSDFLDAYGNLQSWVITLVPETETSNIYQEYTADLSAYNGQHQTGYIAIRHFNCFDEFYLVVDDFSLYDDNAGDEWTTEPDASPSGTTLERLTPGTSYEYQVEYQYGNNTFYTPTMILTTLADDVAPTDLSATAITANTASISWQGFGESYNLRYSKGGMAMVTLYVPSDIWEDGSGYQMLLDADHDTYGYNSIIPTEGAMSGDADELAAKYNEFEFKIPENADCNLSTSFVVNGSNVKEATITIPAGTYDWCITNPTPNDRMWIASERGDVGGRQDDFVFEAGKHYTFTVAIDEVSGNDCVNMTVKDDSSLAQGEVSEITGITGTSYTLSGLTASTCYSLYVQSVNGEKTSEWSRTVFTTLEANNIGLLDDGDNSGIITDNDKKECNVTLVDRTLWKDGDWNTLCLPFAVGNADAGDGHHFDGTSLEGATVMTLSDASFVDGTLTLNFTDATCIDAGKPYIIKWNKADDYDNNASAYDLTNPVFSGVTVSKDLINVKTEYVTFTGTTSHYTLEANDNTKLYLGANNTLYWPSVDVTIGSCRAYFQLIGITAGEPTSTEGQSIKAFVLNFGEEETGIQEIDLSNPSNSSNLSNIWYTLDGIRLNSKPIAKGLYIHKGEKVMIK